MLRIVSLLLPLTLAIACSRPAADPTPTRPAQEAEPAQKLPTPAEAQEFVKRANAELKELWVTQAHAEWAKATNITDETEAAAARAGEATMNYTTKIIQESRKFEPILADLDEDTRRQIQLLRLAGTPAPSEPAAAKELAETTARMESLYGKGKYCPQPDKCRDLGQLEEVLAKSRKPGELLDVWAGWRQVGQEIGPLYKRFVELANVGAREVGYADTGARWRSGYDMTPQAFEKETERLWNDVKPLYDELHCYVRRELVKEYGPQTVPPQGAIPAHLLGNMWAQTWSNIYPLVEPYEGQSSPDVTPALVKQKYDAIRMVKLAESFFTSIGLDALPATFWERSMFEKPADRDVVCHASAWDLTFEGDLRIKMCIRQNQEDLITIHHELGHNYYYNYYKDLPILYQGGAHDGFHEAIGDAIALSITPGYLKQVGLLKKVRKNDRALINQQMFLALDKIAFLPWGLLVDKWRWDVFSEKVGPAQYNEHWWQLREKYQGVGVPTVRDAAAFDPGAKYHIPANVPYTRYFLAFILQFQFHKSLCEAAGHQGPLHECSIYGSKEAGQKLQAMLEMGASRPWPEALAAVTGQQQMSGEALVEYFTPLMGWLKEQNEGQKCGW